MTMKEQGVSDRGIPTFPGLATCPVGHRNYTTTATALRNAQDHRIRALQAPDLRRSRLVSSKARTPTASSGQALAAKPYCPYVQVSANQTTCDEVIAQPPIPTKSSSAHASAEASSCSWRGRAKG